MMSKIPILYRVGRFILGPIFKLYYNPKIINKEYIVNDGPIVIAGNHKHLYDQFLTIIATKRGINYMAKKEYFEKRFSRWIFRHVGCIPVDRTKKDDSAVNSALNVLNNNGAIGIFPEGTRNRTDNLLLPFKFGAVSLAHKTNAYIIPFAITGDYKFRSKNLKIRYGKPFKVGNMPLVDANNKLYREVEKLMKQDLES